MGLEQLEEEFKEQTHQSIKARFGDLLKREGMLSDYYVLDAEPIKSLIGDKGIIWQLNKIYHSVYNIDLKSQKIITYSGSKYYSREAIQYYQESYDMLESYAKNLHKKCKKKFSPRKL